MQRFHWFFSLSIIFSIAILSCQESPSPTVDPVLKERDSLLSIYGNQIDAKEFTYLKLFDHGNPNYTYLYGQSQQNFWFGIFNASGQKIKEYLLNLDPDGIFQNAIYQPAFHSFLVSGFELIEIHGEEVDDDSEDAFISKSILRIELTDFELKSSTSYLPKNELTLLEFARGWKGGFLLEHTGIISSYGKNNTQFLSTDFSESISWDCRAPTTPPQGALYFDEDFYLEVKENSVAGFDYSICKSWAKNILDFYGLSTCPGCSSSIKLLTQIGEHITIEVELNGEVREAVLEYRTGEVISNELVGD